MNILVTGGTGYIGSHTTVELLNDGHTVTIIDNLINSSVEVISKIEKITGKHIKFTGGDLREEELLDKVFASEKFDAVIHFAGLKAVGESVDKPLDYYDNNLISSIQLLHSMSRHGIKKLVFSSSATVYGDPGTTEYSEGLPVGRNISNPYGQSKYMIEQIIRDYCSANPDFQASILRYFNPIGAHKSGLIGENPQGTPNNLMPFIAQVATKQREKLMIFGNDYQTVDGTCRRDYIHVTDLAKGHIAALNHLKNGVSTYNLGSGVSTSVLELVKTFTEVTGQAVPFEFAPRRIGDLQEFFANPLKAKRELDWKTEKSIEDMCRDTWRWQSQLHP